MTDREILDDHEDRIRELEKMPIDLMNIIKTGRFKVRFSKRHVAMWTTSIIIGVFRDALATVWESISQIDLLGGFTNMDVFTMIRPDFVTIALFLWIIGAVLKYRTKLTNNAIPLVLFIVSFVSCSVWGYATSKYLGSVRVIDALLMCGVVHGVIVTAIATYGWDVVHGIKKSKGGNK